MSGVTPNRGQQNEQNAFPLSHFLCLDLAVDGNQYSQEFPTLAGKEPN